MVLSHRRSFAMLANPTPEGIQALIDIDRNIAAGLSVTAEVTSPAPAVMR